MNIRRVRISSRVSWAAAFILISTAARAATFSSSATAPVCNGEDLQNMGPQKGAEKTFADEKSSGFAKGQTFTTASKPVLLKALTYQAEKEVLGVKTYRLRVSTLSGTTLSELRREDATQRTKINGGDYVTWTFDTPVLLSPKTTYGIDVGMTSSDKRWDVGGILYLCLTGESKAGTRYNSGSEATGYGIGDATIKKVGGGYIFHLDIDALSTPAYWDLNGDRPGAGNAAPSGVWDAAKTYWNSAADGGSGRIGAWAGGKIAVFAAGTDATGAYTVTVIGTQEIGGLLFEEGNVTLTGGTALRLSGNTGVAVASGRRATIETPLACDDKASRLYKTGAGTLVLSGENSFKGALVVSAGTLALGRDDVLPDTADVTLGNATLDVETWTDSVGTLELKGDALISLGAGASLAFANSSALAWTGEDGGTLNITGAFVNGKSLRFGTHAKGLTSDQLALISAPGLKNFFLNDRGYLMAVRQ